MQNLKKSLLFSVLQFNTNFLSLIKIYQNLTKVLIINEYYFFPLFYTHDTFGKGKNQVLKC